MNKAMKPTPITLTLAPCHITLNGKDRIVKGYSVSDADNACYGWVRNTTGGWVGETFGDTPRAERMLEGTYEDRDRLAEVVRSVRKHQIQKETGR